MNKQISLKLTRTVEKDQNNRRKRDDRNRPRKMEVEIGGIKGNGRQLTGDWGKVCEGSGRRDGGEVKMRKGGERKRESLSRLARDQGEVKGRGKVRTTCSSS